MNELLLASPWDLMTDPWILFHEPQLLWALLGLPLLALALPGGRPWPERLRNLGTLLIRLVVLAALIIAAARPYQLRKLPDLSLVVAHDLSASMSPARRADVEALVARYLERAPEGVEVREVWLGAQASAAAPPSPAPATQGSSLSALLDLAIASAPPARSRRVLLLSDGADTRGEAGVAQVVRVSAAAGPRGVNVYPVPPAVSEVNVGVVGVDLPVEVDVSDTVSAWFTLRASAAAEVELSLWLGEQRLAGERVQVPAGALTTPLRFRAPRAGTWALEARVDSDAWPEDDRRGAWLVSRGEGPVLAVGPYAEELTAVMRGRGLPARALEAWPSSVPEGAALFVLAPEMEEWPQTRPKQLRSWVRERGVDLILAGGPRGLGAEEPWMEPLDRALPVAFPKQKRREPPPLAVVFLIDRSDSMARSRKLELGVAAVEGAVALLPPEARVGVLAFADDHEWVVPMMRARSPDAISQALSQLTVSGGTRIYPALAEAFDALQATDALLKHVILLTDGSGVTRYQQHLDLLKRIGASPVTVSTVALSGEANTDELQKVAELGRGRYYYTETLDDIPRIFVDETMMLLRRNAVEEDDTVRPIPGSPLAGGVDWSTAPELAGRNEARAKATAELGLVFGDRSRPLLASWRHGLGSATVFASQLGGGWGQRWMEWEGMGPWLSALVEAVRRRPPSEALTLELVPSAEGAHVLLVALDALGSPREGLEPEVEVRGAEGVRTLILVESAPGRYEADVTWDGALLVTASVDASAGSPAGIARAQVAPSAPEELDGSLLDLDALERVAMASGGAVLPDPAALFVDGVRRRDERREIWPWLLWLAALGLLGDVAVRRLRRPRLKR